MPVKKKRKIKIESVLVAEDLRLEVTGLQSIIGVWGNRLNATGKILKLPRLMFRVEFTSEEAFSAQLQLQVVSPSGAVLFRNPAPLSLDVDANNTTVCALGWAPAEFVESGIYTILFSADGSKPSKVKTFEVRLEAPPQ